MGVLQEMCWVFASTLARSESRCASCICLIRVLVSADCHPSDRCWLAWFMYIIYNSWGESAGLLGVLEGGVGTCASLVGFCSGSCIVLRFEGALIVGFLMVVVRLLVRTGGGVVSLEGGFDWLRGCLSEEEGGRDNTRVGRGTRRVGGRAIGIVIEGGDNIRVAA